MTMFYSRSCRLLLYCGILLVLLAIVQDGAEGYRLQKNKKQKSIGKFVELNHRKTGKNTLQTYKDKHRSKRLKPKEKSHSDEPLVMKPVDAGKGGKGRQPVSLNPPKKPGKLGAVLPIMLMPVAAKQKKKPEKKKDKDNPVNDFSHKNFRCPNERIEMNCLSCKTKVYRKCPVVGASMITEVKVLNEYPSSQGRCYVGRKQNFGITDESKLWVDKGCRAKFSVCYNRVIKEPKTISCLSEYDPNKHTHNGCPNGIRQPNIVIKVTLLWSFGKKKCLESRNWGFNDKQIWVEDGCCATFKIFYS